MLRAVFYRQDGSYSGFSVSGHAGFGTEGNDIVCAAVSSAVMLVCNAVTDFLNADASVQVEENRITLRLCRNDDPSQRLIEAFYAHMEAIAEEYGRIKLEAHNIGGQNND